nr:immunoglobulin light chain junction region [Macaca mulatta]MOV37330.1 immunoglobulin light chain junction region [Macaca mulatta]
CMQHKALPYSF